MLDVIDIHIHLDKHYPPDPTGVTDYVALGLVGAYAAGTFVGNVALARAARAWKPVHAVNIPLVYAMTLFSMCHLACVCLDVGLFPGVTAAVQRLSCVGTSFWGEYLLGLGGFLGVLGVRAYSLMMVAYSGALRPDGPKYRRSFAKGIFFAMFLLPVYSLCLLISVDAESTYDAEVGGCETPVVYKGALVLVLVAYLVGLSVQGGLLAASDVVADRARTLLAIIRVAVPLLVVACVIHFAYMIPHWWGRFAFLCVVLVLYTHAYCTLVVPALWDYWTTGRRAHRTPSVNLDAFDEAPAVGVLATESPLLRGGATARRMSADIRWLLETMDARNPQITPQMLIRVEDLRARFFNFAKVEFASFLFTYTTDGLAHVDLFTPLETHHIPTYRLITFYNDVHRIHAASQQVYSTDKFLNADAVKTILRPMISALFRTYLADESMTPINLPARYATRLRKGFSGLTVAEWDTPVLTEIMTEILRALLDTSDGEYHPQFLADIDEVLESYGHTLHTLDEEYLVVYSGAEPTNSAIGNIAQLLDVLRRGRAATRDPDALDLDASDSDVIDDLYGDSGSMFNDDDLSEILQAAPRGESGDEPLPDGAIIYATPLRALGFFFYDAVHTVPRIFGSCRKAGSVHVAAMDIQDEDILVQRTPAASAA